MQISDKDILSSGRDEKLPSAKSSIPQYLVKPSGQYSVGFQIREELAATVYYPSVQSSMPGSVSKSVEKLKADIKQCGIEISKEEFDSLDLIRTYAKENLAIVPNQTFPVVIFSPGSNSPAGYYENTIADLVSRGYLVIARDNIENLEQPREKTPKEVLAEIIAIRDSMSRLPKDNPIYAAMQMDQIGLLGHSMGGAMSVLAAQLRPELFQGVAALDAPVDRGIRRIILSNNEPQKPLAVGVLYLQNKVNDSGETTLWYSHEGTNKSEPNLLESGLSSKLLESKQLSLSYREAKYSKTELTASSHPELFQKIIDSCGQEAYLWDIRREVKIPAVQIHATTWKLNYSGQDPDAPFDFNQNTTHILLGTDQSDKYYSDHNNFSDNSTLQAHPAAQAFEKFLIGMKQQYPEAFGVADVRTPIQTGTIDGVEASKTVTECVGQFFDTCLKKKLTPIYSKDQPCKNTTVTRGDRFELSEIKPLRAASHYHSAMFSASDSNTSMVLEKKSSAEISQETDDSRKNTIIPG